MTQNSQGERWSLKSLLPIPVLRLSSDSPHILLIFPVNSSRETWCLYQQIGISVILPPPPLHFLINWRWEDFLAGDLFPWGCAWEPRAWVLAIQLWWGDRWIVEAFSRKFCRALLISTELGAEPASYTISTSLLNWVRRCLPTLMSCV